MSPRQMQVIRTYAVVPKSSNPDRYLPGSWPLMCEPRLLAEKVAELEGRENVRITAIYDDKGKKVEGIR